MRIKISSSTPECWYHGMINQQFNIVEASEYERTLRINPPLLASEYFAVSTGDEQGLYIRKGHCEIVSEVEKVIIVKAS